MRKAARYCREFSYYVPKTNLRAGMSLSVDRRFRADQVNGVEGDRDDDGDEPRHPVDCLF